MTLTANAHLEARHHLTAGKTDTSVPTTNTTTGGTPS